VGLHPDPEFRGIAASRLLFAPRKELAELIGGLSLQRVPRDLPALRRQGHDMPTRRFAEPPLSPTGRLGASAGMLFDLIDQIVSRFVDLRNLSWAGSVIP
jgi:hypothetical protein